MKLSVRDINNAKNNDKCREVYNELDGSSIPKLTDDLNLQVQIEQLAINFFLLGYKKAELKDKQYIAHLKHYAKIQQQRIHGLESMLKVRKKK